MKFSARIPGLLFLQQPGEQKVHIARTCIAGGVTECGRTLVQGESFTRREPDRGSLCISCAQALEQLRFGPRNDNRP